jgi:predicted amidohydrolase
MSTIAVAQLCSTSSKLENLYNIAKCAHQARQHHCVMLFLPECFGYMGESSEETVTNAEPPIDLISTNVEALSQALVSIIDGKEMDRDTLQSIQDDRHPVSLYHGLQQIARHSQLWISAGGMHIRSSKDTKVYNTHLILNHQGEWQCHYRKIHLFDVHIPGKVDLRESKTTLPGHELVVCDSPVGALTIYLVYNQYPFAPSFNPPSLSQAAWDYPRVTMYDFRNCIWNWLNAEPKCYWYHRPLRFPREVRIGIPYCEVRLCKTRLPLEKTYLFSHFLLTARAIEHQCYVIAAAQYGQHNTKRCSYGHSLVVNPWGEVLVDAGGVDRPLTEPPSIVTCDIDLSQIQSIRERMPISVHRKNAKWTT